MKELLEEVILCATALALLYSAALLAALFFVPLLNSLGRWVRKKFTKIDSIYQNFKNQ